MGLGSLDTISPAEVRDKTAESRRLRAKGVDPIKHRNAERMQVALDAAKAMTFDRRRDAYTKAKGSGWRSVKHRGQ